MDSIIWRQYDDLYHKTLPEVVSEYAPTSFYWPSSPFSHYDRRPQPNEGDYHLWTVWGGGKPFDEFDQFRSRFFSEYGFQSFPTLETVKKYAPNEKDWDINSDVMMAHQRGGMNANNRINNYMMEYYPAPKDFESLLYMTQLLQGQAIRTAVEAHRRDKPYCMGSLFWQHNDCWPVASWSSRDYYGNWKAQHYYARRFFDDILVSNLIDNTTDSLTVSVISDRTKHVDGTLRVQILTLNGDIIFEKEVPLVIPDDAVVKIDFDMKDMIGNKDRPDLIILSEYTTKDNDRYQGISPMLKDKDMNYQSPTIQWSLTEYDGDRFLTVDSDTFVRGLFITLPDGDCRYSDNFIDLIPNHPVNVKLITDLDLDDIKKAIRLTDVYSASH